MFTASVVKKNDKHFDTFNEEKTNMSLNEDELVRNKRLQHSLRQNQRELGNKCLSAISENSHLMIIMECICN